MKIYELGKELGVENKAIVDFLNAEGADVKSQSSVPENMLEKVRAKFSKKKETADSVNVNSVSNSAHPEVKAIAMPGGVVKKQAVKEATTEEAAKEKTEVKPAAAEAPKKKKIIAVFNPQHSQTNKGRQPGASRPARDGQHAQGQNRQQNVPGGQPRRPLREDELPSRRRPARDRVPDDEKITPVNTLATETKTSAEPVKEEVKAAETVTPPTPVEQKPVKEVKTEPAKAAEVKAEPVKSVDTKADPAKKESEAIKSLREKLVKGTVKVQDIPVSRPTGSNGDRRNNNNNGDRRNNNSNGDRRNNSSNNGDRRNNNGGQNGNRYFVNNNGQGSDRRNNNGQGGFNNRGNGGYNKDNDNRSGAGRDQRRNGGGAAVAAAAPAKNDAKGHTRNQRGSKFEKSAHGDKFDRLENEKFTKGSKQVVKQEPEEEEIKVLTLPETISIKDLAAKMKQQPAALIKKLFLQGQVYTVNDIIDYETAEAIALENDIICEHEVVVDYIEELLKEEDDPEETMVKRPPVVCVMGHVDHGKTSLLDAIRNTHVTAREAGGITQHIGAYTVEVNGEQITFLDTPGHEAFTAMRLRGAQSTDVAILVVAADDGVMPQTIEAISHAKAAGIHVIVAVNKIDKPGANIDRVKQELSEQGLVPEEWGGDTIFVPISAKTGENIDQLLEMVILDTQILDLKANPNRMARGIVIEAKLDKGRGSVATLLVQKGTLKVGDHIAMGESYGKVRAMTNDKGQKIKTAGPSTPVEITGMSSVPNAGDTFVAFDNDKDAKSFAQVYVEENKKKLLAGTKAKMSLDDVFSQMKAGELKNLDIIIKADVQGSVEAIKESLEKLSNDEVCVRVIHSGVGNINESDAILASASNAIIIAFNVQPDAVARNTIEREKVDLRKYSVIYNAIDDVQAAMNGMLEPVYEEAVIGHAEVRQTFKASGVGVIAGSYVLDGIVRRGAKVRLNREGEQIYEGTVASLKRFSDDAREVKAGFECGIVLDGFSDVKEGDTMEIYEMKEVPRA